MSDKPRAYTREEAQAMFIDHAIGMCNYWAKQPGTDREKLAGLAFSLMVALDGGSCMPAFHVLTSPHPDDAEFHRAEGENWWPVECDIAGVLHELFCARDKP